jgi:hypothetical protein
LKQHVEEIAPTQETGLGDIPDSPVVEQQQNRQVSTHKSPRFPSAYNQVVVSDEDATDVDEIHGTQQQIDTVIADSQVPTEERNQVNDSVTDVEVQFPQEVEQPKENEVHLIQAVNQQNIVEEEKKGTEQKKPKAGRKKGAKNANLLPKKRQVREKRTTPLPSETIDNEGEESDNFEVKVPASKRKPPTKSGSSQPVKDDAAIKLIISGTQILAASKLKVSCPYRCFKI